MCLSMHSFILTMYTSLPVDFSKVSSTMQHCAQVRYALTPLKSKEVDAKNSAELLGCMRDNLIKMNTQLASIEDELKGVRNTQKMHTEALREMDARSILQLKKTEKMGDTNTCQQIVCTLTGIRFFWWGLSKLSS